MYQELCWLVYLHYIISSSYCPCELEVSLILHMRKLTWPKTHAKRWPIGNLPGLSSGCAGLHTSSSHARPGNLPEQSMLLHPSLICISTALFIMFSSILVHLGKTHSPLRPQVSSPPSMKLFCSSFILLYLINIYFKPPRPSPSSCNSLWHTSITPQ